jgi:hypothetical protein
MFKVQHTKKNVPIRDDLISMKTRLYVAGKIYFSAFNGKLSLIFFNKFISIILLGVTGAISKQSHHGRQSPSLIKKDPPWRS